MVLPKEKYCLSSFPKISVDSLEATLKNNVIIKNLLSDTLSKKIQALQDVDRILSSKSNVEIEDIWRLINKQNIINIVIIEKYHPEIIKRSIKLIKYYIAHTKHHQPIIDFIWKKVTSPNIEDSNCGNEVLKQIGAALDEAEIITLIDLYQALDKHTLNKWHILGICSLYETSFNYSATTFEMNKIDDSSKYIARLDNLPMESVEYLISLVESPELDHKLKKDIIVSLQGMFKLPQLAKMQAVILESKAKKFNSIKSIINYFLIFDFMIDLLTLMEMDKRNSGIFVLTNNQRNLVGSLVLHFSEYYANARTMQVEKGINSIDVYNYLFFELKHRKVISNFLYLLERLFINSNHKLYFKVNVFQCIWFNLVTEPLCKEDTDVFFERLMNKTKGVYNLLGNEVIPLFDEHFLNPKNMSPTRITDIGFKCFKQLFYDCNVENKNFVISKDGGINILKYEAIGTSMIWDIYLLSQEQSVIESSMMLLVEIHAMEGKQNDAYKRFTEKFIDCIFNKLVTSPNKDILEKCLKLLIKYIDYLELKSYEKTVPKIQGNFVQVKFTYDYNEYAICVDDDLTIDEVNKIISNKIKVPANRFKMYSTETDKLVFIRPDNQLEDILRTKKKITIKKDMLTMYRDNIPALYITNHQIYCSIIAKIIMSNDSSLLDHAYSLLLMLPCSSTNKDFIDSLSFLMHSANLQTELSLMFCLNSVLCPNIFSFLYALSISISYKSDESETRIDNIIKCEIQLYIMDLIAQTVGEQCCLSKLLIIKLCTDFLLSFVSRTTKEQELSTDRWQTVLL